MSVHACRLCFNRVCVRVCTCVHVFARGVAGSAEGLDRDRGTAKGARVSLSWGAYSRRERRLQRERDFPQARTVCQPD